MKFGTLLEYNLIKIFGYRAIADFPGQMWQPFSKTATIDCYSTFDMVDQVHCRDVGTDLCNSYQ